MSRKYIPLIIIFLVITFVIGTITGNVISASGGLVKLNEVFANNNINIIINGDIFDEIDPQDNSLYVPLTYKNRTYLPLRAVADSLNMSVEYDEKSDTVFLDSNYETQISSNAGNYLILIETEAQRKSVENFKRFKESQGFKVTIKSVEADISIKSGSETTGAIYYYLHDLDSQLSLDYVLFIGEPYNKDTACPQNTGGIIPMRYFYPDSNNHNTRYNFDYYDYNDSDKIAFNTPSDLFYAYDFNWDYDGDGYAGEYDDVFNQNTSSIKPLFMLGRVPFSDNTSINTVLNNTITYENNQKKHSDVLIASGILHYPESESHNYLSDGANYANKLSENFNKLNIANVTLYEKNGLMPSKFSCTYPLNQENFNRELQKKYDLTYTFGHGGTDMELWEKDRNNNGYCDENISSYSLYPYDSSSLLTGFIYLDGCHTMSVEKNTEHYGRHIQDFLVKGMTCAGLATTRDSGFSAKLFQPRLVNFMFQNGSLTISQEFYSSALKMINEERNISEAYIFCYLGDPSIQLKQ